MICLGSVLGLGHIALMLHTEGKSKTHNLSKKKIKRWDSQDMNGIYFVFIKAWKHFRLCMFIFWNNSWLTILRAVDKLEYLTLDMLLRMCHWQSILSYMPFILHITYRESSYAILIPTCFHYVWFKLVFEHEKLTSCAAFCSFVQPSRVYFF